MTAREPLPEPLPDTVVVQVLLSDGTRQDITFPAPEAPVRIEQEPDTEHFWSDGSYGIPPAEVIRPARNGEVTFTVRPGRHGYVLRTSVPPDTNSGEGWYEVTHADGTASVACVRENGDVYWPGSGYGNSTFAEAAARDKVHKLVRADRTDTEDARLHGLIGSLRFNCSALEAQAAGLAAQVTRLREQLQETRREGTVTLTREQLADVLTRITARVKTSGPAAGMIDAEQMADAIIEAARDNT